MSEPVIVVHDLTRRFGTFTAVDHINFEVAAGEVVGYLGPNGSGKTTTIRMLLGLLEPSDGRATVLGFDAFKQSEQVRARAGYMSQKFSLYDDLTVEENLDFFGGVYGVPQERRQEREHYVLRMAGLLDRRASMTRLLAGGFMLEPAPELAAHLSAALQFYRATVETHSSRWFWGR